MIYSRIFKNSAYSKRSWAGPSTAICSSYPGKEISSIKEMNWRIRSISPDFAMNSAAKGNKDRLIWHVGALLSNFGFWLARLEKKFGQIRQPEWKFSNKDYGQFLFYGTERTRMAKVILIFRTSRPEFPREKHFSQVNFTWEIWDHFENILFIKYLKNI